MKNAKRNMKDSIEPAKGKLGVLLPGLGAVASTFIAGVHLINRGWSRPFGSLTQMQTIRLGKKSENRSPLIKDFVPLADLSKLCFAAWDVFPDDGFVAAVKAGVIPDELLSKVQKELAGVVPWRAVFEGRFVPNLKGPHRKKYTTKMGAADALRRDIRKFRKAANVARCVMIWCGSTEIFLEEKPVHRSLRKFEAGLKRNSRDISPSMIYAYAALKEGVPFANGAPNLCVDIPALRQLAEVNGLPVAGKDFKTGQTLLKTIIAPGLKARMLGVRGWYSTNILGNRDGEILDDPQSFKTKEKSKMSVLDTILQPELYPELYRDCYHKVAINYYPPRGDAKEGWDNIDIFGWLGMPMSIKLNFLCRDSILAAPVLLDIVLLLDLAQRAGLSGVQQWLSFYWKSPQTPPGIEAEHDLFIQHIKLKNTLRQLMGEPTVDHSLASE